MKQHMLAAGLHRKNMLMLPLHMAAIIDASTMKQSGAAIPQIVNVRAQTCGWNENGLLLEKNHQYFVHS